MSALEAECENNQSRFEQLDKQSGHTTLVRDVGTGKNTGVAGNLKTNPKVNITYLFFFFSSLMIVPFLS